MLIIDASAQSAEYMKKPSHGFLLGKFYPPSEGHQFLFDAAAAYCDHLTILIATLPSETIPGELRYEWVKQMAPANATVYWYNQDIQQEPKDDADQAFWDEWKSVAMSVAMLAMDAAPDVVFASEEYGHRLAKELGARFVPIDVSRTARPISGTKVRSDPFGHWEYLPPPVRPYFVKRVCLFGPESTGKSTLSRELASYFQTIVVPEYGRTYTEAFGPEVDETDLQRIVQGHIATVAAAKRQANRILIEDTDPVMTAVWSDMLIGKRHPWFDEFNDYADLYLLTDVDIPWEDDGTRYFKNDDDRRRFFDICEAELKSRNIPYVRMSGGRDERFANAVAAVKDFCGI